MFKCGERLIAFVARDGCSPILMVNASCSHRRASNPVTTKSVLRGNRLVVLSELLDSLSSRPSCCARALLHNGYFLILSTCLN